MTSGLEGVRGLVAKWRERAAKLEPFGHGAAMLAEGCRACADELEAALTAEGVPDGWVLVPMEPTDEMVEAAWDSDAADYVGEHKRIHSLWLAWAAMIAAAPSAKEPPHV